MCNPELAFKFYIEIAIATDLLASSAGSINKDSAIEFSSIAYDFMTQAFLVYEDEDDHEQQDEDARDFEHYIETMREDGTWGGNLEIVAAARLYK